MYKIIIFPKALKDIKKAKAWYKKEAGEFLSLRFKACIKESIEKLKSDKIEYGKIDEGFNRVFVKKFPYCIYYRKNEKEILIFAVYHNKQTRLGLQERI